MENRYVGKCECLTGGDIQDSSCLKRYYRVFDPRKGEDIQLIFCNDYLKLTIHNATFGRGDIKKGVEELICDALEIDYKLVMWINKKFLVHIKICDRPYIFWRASLKEAIDCYLENRSPQIFNDIKQTLTEWAVANERYKKHNKAALEINRILNKIRWAYDRDQIEILANELMLFILQTLLKSDETNKQQIPAPLHI